MSWDRTGQIVRSQYIGRYLVKGTILNSRVALGGKIKHTLKLIEPVEIYGCEREQVLINEQDILS